MLRSIGDAAVESGVSAKMIRHYESLGLMAPATRSSGRFRYYDDAEIQELRFIASGRHLGFSLEVIGQLLGLWRNRARPSAAVKTIVLDHIHELDQRIKGMIAMKAALEELAGACHGDDAPDCPIIDHLAGSAPEPRT